MEGTQKKLNYHTSTSILASHKLDTFDSHLSEYLDLLSAFILKDHSQLQLRTKNSQSDSNKDLLNEERAVLMIAWCLLERNQLPIDLMRRLHLIVPSKSTFILYVRALVGVDCCAEARRLIESGETFGVDNVWIEEIINGEHHMGEEVVLPDAPKIIVPVATSMIENIGGFCTPVVIGMVVLGLVLGDGRVLNWLRRKGAKTLEIGIRNLS